MVRCRCDPYQGTLFGMRPLAEAVLNAFLLICRADDKGFTILALRRAGEGRPVSAKEADEDRWHLKDVVLPLPRPGSPVPESGGRLAMEALVSMPSRLQT